MALISKEVFCNALIDVCNHGQRDLDNHILLYDYKEGRELRVQCVGEVAHVFEWVVRMTPKEGPVRYYGTK